MRIHARLALPIVAVAAMWGCGDPDPRAACAREFGEPAESELVFTSYARHGSDRLVDGEAHFQVASFAAQEEFAAFWDANEDLLRDDLPQVDFGTRQAVVTDLAEEMCWDVYQAIGGFYRSTRGDGSVVAELLLLPECDSVCEGESLRVSRVYAVERGDLEVCSWSEVCEPDSGYR